MKLRNLTRKLRLISRKAAYAAVVVSIVAVSGSKAFAGWTPDRPTYEYGKFDSSKPCTDPVNAFGQCGSLTGPVWNSFVNTPFYGDERAFFDNSRMNEPAVFQDVLNDATKGSQDVILRMYVHNNANSDTNGAAMDGVGVAHGAQVKITLPTGTDTALRPRAYISANNATTVTDTTELVDSSPFSLEYVKDSAVLFNTVHKDVPAKLSDNIVTTGAPIGYQNMDGTYPGCFDYQAIVEITVHVHKIAVNKTVRKAGGTSWDKAVTVKPGEKVQWLIQTQNQGSGDLTHLNISDQLPPHLKLVPGSVRYVDSLQDVVQQDGPVFVTGGIDGGTWHPGGGFSVRFDTTALDDFSECSLTMRNIGFSKSDQITEQQSNADVTITKENCNKPTPPTTTTKPAEKPKTLQNTGPGDMLGLFTATSAGAGAAHHVLTTRRKRQ